MSRDVAVDFEQQNPNICRFGCKTSSYATIDDKYAKRILENVTELHMNFECPFRTIKCESCTMAIRAKDMDEHKLRLVR